MHVCVDDATRIAYVEVLDDEKAVTAAGFLRRAVAHYRAHGIRVERVLTDNGSCYRAVVHALACKALGIKHLRTRPYRPRTNGKAERFIRTMLGGWAYGAIYGNSQERRAAFPGAQLAGGFLFDRPLGGRQGFETLVRNRLAALDREPVRARGEPRLGPLDRCELVAQVVGQALVELFLGELGGEVAGIEVVRLLARVGVRSSGQRALDTGALGGQEFAGPVGIHGPTVTDQVVGYNECAGRVTATLSGAEESPDTAGQDAGETPGGESRRKVAQKGDRLRRQPLRRRRR